MAMTGIIDKLNQLKRSTISFLIILVDVLLVSSIFQRGELLDQKVSQSRTVTTLWSGCVLNTSPTIRPSLFIHSYKTAGSTTRTNRFNSDFLS